MQAGSAWVDITPDRPLNLMGQMHERLSESTRDPLTLNLVLLDDGSVRIALVSIDVCVVPDELIARLREAISSAADVPAEAIHIAATHTHVAPYTSDRIKGAPDDAWLAELVEHARTAATEAAGDLTPVTLFAGNGYVEQMGWNRRGMRRDGQCHMYFGQWSDGFVGIEGPRDGHVGLIFARDEAGGMKFVISSFSTHPNCNEGANYYSADIPGEVRKMLRQVYGPQLGVVYFTGAAGDTAPTIMKTSHAKSRTWRGEEGVVRSGRYLGAEMVKIISGSLDEPMVGPTLANESRGLSIPMRPWCETGMEIEGRKGSGIYDFWKDSKDNWAKLEAEDNPVHTPVGVVRIGDAAVCFNPSELFCEFGLAIKKDSPARVTLIAELADGYVGYVPTADAILHGGYSAAALSHTRLVPDAGWQIVENTRDMLASAFESA